MLFVWLAEHRVAVARSLFVALARRVVDDGLGRVLVAVGGVFDHLLLGQLEALGLSAAGLLHRTPLFATALFELVLVHLVGVRVHRHNRTPPGARYAGGGAPPR